MSTMAPSFSYKERVLLLGSTADDHDDDGSSRIRWESLAEWNFTSTMHPFQRLQQLFLLPEESNSLMDSRGDENDISITIQIASDASQSFPTCVTAANHHPQDCTRPTLDLIPRWGEKNDDYPTSPSGFWIKIVTAASLSQVQRLVQNLVGGRLITTPLQGAPWNVRQVVDSDLNDNRSSTTTSKKKEYELFLPNEGSAWSVDALQQTMNAIGSRMSGCDAVKNSLFDKSAMELSKMLVNGSTYSRRTWWAYRVQNGKASFNTGLQYHDSRSLSKSVNDKSLFGPNNNKQLPCFFGTPRQIFLVQPRGKSTETALRLKQVSSWSALLEENKASPVIERDDSPRWSVDQVFRRPKASNGRLETWISTSRHDDRACQVEVRQVVPPFITPSWQTLTVTTADEQNLPIDLSHSSVDWDKEQRSSILTLRTEGAPESFAVRIDASVMFLGYDEFPGDPNRGRELPPAAVTWHCSQESFTTTLYTNSVLLLPPVPDMSMPFNVLSLTCSLYAYVIGTVVTLLVKRASERVTYKLHPHKRPLSMAQRIKSKINKFRDKRENKVGIDPTTSKDGATEDSTKS